MTTGTTSAGGAKSTAIGKKACGNKSQPSP